MRYQLGIYVFNFLSMPVYGKVFRRRSFCWLASMQMFLILALRADTVGIDLSTYHSAFDYISQLNFEELLSKLHFFQVAGLPYPYSLESGWVVLNWVLSFLGLGFRGLLVFCAATNMVACGQFIYEYSKKPWLSYCIVSGLGIYSCMFGILRQALALSLVLFSICSFDKGNWKKAAVLFALAFTVHRTAMVALVLFALMKLGYKKKKQYIRAFLAWVPFMCVSPIIYNRFVKDVMLWFGKGYSGNGLHWNNLMTLLLLIVMAIIALCDFRKIDGKVGLLSIWAVLAAVYWETFGLYNDNFARSVQFLTFFVALAIPQVLVGYSDKRVAKIGEAMAYFLLFGFMAYSLHNSDIVPYVVL